MTSVPSDEARRLAAKDLELIWHPCSQMKDYEDLPPIVVRRGQGSYLYDVDGQEYIDIISSWWCNLLGHCHPAISAAITEQLGRLEHVIFANFTHEPAIHLAEELKALLPPGLTKFHFSDNGSAAVECALKMSLQYQYQTGHPERTRFMCLSNGYHGETIGALSVGGLDLYTQIYKPMLIRDILRIEAPDCYRCPYGKNRETCGCECFVHAEELFARHADETCAVIVEPLLQGSAGMRIYPADYLLKLRRLCNQTGILLIADEIATGFGRTGKLFACDHAGITPDIMCLSKGLTGGFMPMSITAVTQEIYDAFYADYREGKAFLHSHTYSGNPLGCATARAVLKVLREEPILATAHETATYLTERLQATFGAHPHVGEIRHIGLIHALELVENRATKRPFTKSRVGYAVYKEALKRGLLLRPLGDVLYFNPPLTITKGTLDQAIARFEDALKAVLVNGRYL